MEQMQKGDEAHLFRCQTLKKRNARAARPRPPNEAASVASLWQWWAFHCVLRFTARDSLIPGFDDERRFFLTSFTCAQGPCRLSSL